MGIQQTPMEFVRELGLAPGFSVCELGDQWITYNVHRLAREFYQELGCKRYESIDGNARGTITADLNNPLKPWPGQFDLVTDFGTGEHVFNQHQVWKTIHDLTKPGGYIVFDHPTQGYEGGGGHGYWNAQPCLYDDIARFNNYHVLRTASASTNRGELIRGIWRRQTKDKFRVPQQGRYRKLLRPITGEPAKVARSAL